MSGLATIWAWKQSVGNPMRKLVLLHMADAVSKENDWQSWYSLSAIAERCDCSRGSVRNHINALVERGYLTMTQPSSRHGKPAKYRLNVGKVEVQVGHSGGTTNEQPSTRDVPPPSTTDIQGGTPDEHGVYLVNEGGTRDVPKPITKPSNKPSNKQIQGLEIPESICEKLFVEYLEMRKQMKRPASPTAKKGAIKQILKTSGATGKPPNEIIEIMLCKNWLSIKPDWITNKPNSFGQQTSDKETQRANNAALAAQMFKDSDNVIEGELA